MNPNKINPKLKILNLQSQDGIVALLTIVIIATASLLVAYSASIMGLGELELGYYSQQGAEAFSVADGCMEEGLRRFRFDSGYSGGSLNLGDGSCIISVAGVGSTRIFTVTGTVGQYNKKIEANLSFTESVTTGVVITITSWQELSDWWFKILNLMNKEKFKIRTKLYVLRIIKLIDVLPKTTAGRVIGWRIRFLAWINCWK